MNIKKKEHYQIALTNKDFVKIMNILNSTLVSKMSIRETVDHDIIIQQIRYVLHFQTLIQLIFKGQDEGITWIASKKTC